MRTVNNYDPLLAEPRAVSAVFPFLYSFYPDSVYLHTSLMLIKVYKFVCDRSVIYVYLFEEPCGLMTVYKPVLEGFP